MVAPFSQKRDRGSEGFCDSPMVTQLVGRVDFWMVILVTPWICRKPSLDIAWKHNGLRPGRGPQSSQSGVGGEEQVRGKHQGHKGSTTHPL